MESREVFVGADEVEDDAACLRLGREKRAADSLVGDIAAPPRVDPDTVDMLETLDFLPGVGLVLKGSRRPAVLTVDILFAGAAGFAAGSGGGFIPTDIVRGLIAPARAARVCLGGGAALGVAALGVAALGVAALGVAAAFGGAGCETMCEMPAARTRRPCSGGQLKYLSPCTEPSFLPEGSESSTPMNWPAATWMSPMNLMTPRRPSEVSIVWPTLNSAMADAVRQG